MVFARISNFLAQLVLSAGFVLQAGQLSGCDQEGRVRAEARTFLSLYEATDHRAPIPERERKLVQLEQLTLTQEPVRQARDECVAAHRTLIDAERQNEKASVALDQALAAQPTGEALPSEATARIRGRIDQAEQALVDSRKRFERCETQARSLDLRFGGK